MEYDNPNLLIQPVSFDPFVYKQYRHFVDGQYTGELFFSYQFECMFRSIESGRVCVQHGRWEYCSHIQAIKAFYDFEESTEDAKLKWIFFRGTEGIDYAARQIRVVPTAEWKWNYDETHIVRSALPYPGDSIPGIPPGLFPTVQFYNPHQGYHCE